MTQSNPPGDQRAPEPAPSPRSAKQQLEEFLSLQAAYRRLHAETREASRAEQIARGQIVITRGGQLAPPEMAQATEVLQRAISAEVEARAALNKAFPRAKRFADDVGIQIVTPAEDEATTDAIHQAIGDYEEWIASGLKPGGSAITANELGARELLVAPQQSPAAADGKAGSDDPVAEANKRRRNLETVFFLGSGAMFLAGLAWVWETWCAIEDRVLVIESFTLGVGLVLIGKAVIALLLFGAAGLLFRAGERFNLPIQEYLKVVQHTSKHGDDDEFSIVERVLQVLKATKELGDKS